MDKLYDPSNLRKFCEHIARAIESKNDHDLLNLITILKVIIVGPPGDRCHSFYIKKLSSERCVVAGLRARSTQAALISNPEICTKLVNLILSLPHLSDQIVRAIGCLVICVKSSDGNLRKTFALQVLNHTDLRKIDAKTVAFCLQEDKSVLETSLLDLCLNPEGSFRCPEYHWIEWCSESPRIFQTLAGIYNELLIRLNCKPKVIASIDAFIHQMTSFCVKNDIDLASLYPFDVQSLVGMLLLDPKDVDIPELRIEINRQFASVQMSDISKALMLSTHFPRWNSVLEIN